MGNIGSGYKGMCGFPDGYFPLHAPLGFPNCANYKGSQSQRIESLITRGYGNDTVSYWNKYYEDQKTAIRVDAVIKQRMAIVDSERAAEAQIQLQREQKIYDAGVKEAQRLQKVAEDKILQQIKDQEITFNEQINSGDFNETPITEINLSSGCSECTGTDLETGMTEDELGNKPINNNMKIVGITAIGLIGLLVFTK